VFKLAAVHLDSAVFPTSGEGLKPTENLGRADDLKANVSNQNPVVPRTGVDLQVGCFLCE
jgi:hypothetical protein